MKPETPFIKLKLSLSISRMKTFIAIELRMFLKIYSYIIIYIIT